MRSLLAATAGVCIGVAVTIHAFTISIRNGTLLRLLVEQAAVVADQRDAANRRASTWRPDP